MEKGNNKKLHPMQRPLRKTHRYCWFCRLMLRLRIPMRCLNCIRQRDKIIQNMVDNFGQSEK